MRENAVTEYTQDKHLNIFTHYAESSTDIILENNLTRALAIVLQSDEMVRDSLLSSIVTNYRDIEFDDDVKFQIDIQRDATKIDATPNIYAVSLTTRNFTKEEFRKATENSTETQRPDLTLTFGDTLIVVEVKRTGEDCLNQLKTQISRIQGETKSEYEYISLSWSRIIEIIENVCQKRLAGNFQQNRVTSDFVGFLKMQYPEWVSAKPLSKIKEISDSTIPQISKRIDRIKSSLGRDINTTGGRNSISIDWNIASEINIHPYKSKESKNDFITVAVWPGDTKGQGWGVWCNERWKKWITENAMEISGYTFEIEANPYIKFSHFQQGVDWLWIKQDDYSKLGEKFFREISGRKWRQDWGKFDSQLSSYIPDWKNHCNWIDKFENSNRNKVETSIGCEYTIYIPYAIAAKFDTSESDTTEITKLLNGIIEEMKLRLVGK